MIVCICHRVSDHDIQKAVRDGVRSFSDLQYETGVSAGCGCCRDCAQEVFEAACSQRCGVAVPAACTASKAAPVSGPWTLRASAAA